MDPQLLDSININDPILTQIIPENLLNSVNIEQLIEDNPQYFHHQLGLCACYKCSCGRCKCDVGHSVKLKVNGTQNTVYGKDFNEKPSQSLNNLMPLNQTNYETKYLQQKTIDLMSTNQSHFKRKQPIQSERYQDEQLKDQQEGASLTSYRTNFQNWGAHDFKLFKRPQHVSTSPEIPFIGKSNYQETFSHNRKKGESSNNNQKNHLSPIPSGPFMGSSTHQRTFIPFKINRSSNDKKLKAYKTTPIYEGQFTSTTIKDYKGDKDSYCPANLYNKLWRKKLAAKYNHLRELKLKKYLEQ